MLAIVKEKHLHFCKRMEDFKISLALDDHKLTGLESELNEIFKTYQHSLNDLKSYIMEYELKRKEIRRRMKQLLVYKLPEKKNPKLLPG